MITRAYGCLIGSAIGDAMGMPASFMSPEKIKRIYQRITNFLPPAKEQIAHGGLAKAEFTDDTEEGLIIAAVLIEAGKFDVPLFIEKMKNWAIQKKMLESTVIGPATRRFLEAIVKGEDYSTVGQIGDTNGGAMRVAPVGIFYHGRIDQAIEAAIASARPSHGSRPGLASTAAVAAAIAAAVEGSAKAREVMAAALRGAEAGEKEGFDIPAPSVAARIRLAIELVDQNREKSLEEISYILYQYIGAGMKSYESIPLSLGIFYAAGGDYQTGLLAAINIGDDADTNGAIVGALCGAFSGSEKINPAWIEKISQTNSIDFLAIANQLMDRNQ
ncbi:MAG: ADP-ribosylglycohydrolase family protein [Anaerolineaceae bacterium]|nr:ADP-ribosylglycohydrolase family protein [Anaerolineaceae bacterium]